MSQPYFGKPNLDLKTLVKEGKNGGGDLHLLNAKKSYKRGTSSCEHFVCEYKWNPLHYFVYLYHWAILIETTSIVKNYEKGVYVIVFQLSA